MNCQDIANLLDNREIVELTPTQQTHVTAHLSGCDACNDEWRAVRALWEISTHPAPTPRPDLFAETMRLATATGVRKAPRIPRQPSFWLGAGIGGALAASLVVAVMTFVLAPGARRADSAPSITIALNESRDVGVAINSAEALADAQIRVVLTGGIRLAGFADRSEVSWTTDLDRGVNRLTLPVVALDARGGQVLVEVEHSSRRQIFVVNVGVDSSSDATARLVAESRLPLV